MIVFKTLKEIGWIEKTGVKGMFFTCSTPIGDYKVFSSLWYYELGDIQYEILNHDEGMQRAEEHFAAICKSLTKEIIT